MAGIVSGHKSSLEAQRVLGVSAAMGTKVDLVESKCLYVPVHYKHDKTSVSGALNVLRKVAPKTVQDAHVLSAVEEMAFGLDAVVLSVSEGWTVEGTGMTKAKEHAASWLEYYDALLYRHTYIAESVEISAADIFLALAIVAGVNCKLIDESQIAKKACVARMLNSVASFKNGVAFTAAGVKYSAIKPVATSAYVIPACPTAFAHNDDHVAQKAQAAQPAAKSNADLMDEAEAPVKKVTNPLDLLPPTTFNLENWKREYSNAKTPNARQAMPWFWANIDLEGFSFWSAKYDKLDVECKQGFLTQNLLEGYFQRMDSNLRRYSFAVYNVIGEEGNYDIQGVFLVRGNEIPPELKSHPSNDYFKWTKLDGTNPAHKKLIEDEWCAGSNEEVIETIDGRNIYCTKQWK